MVGFSVDYACLDIYVNEIKYFHPYLFLSSEGHWNFWKWSEIASGGTVASLGKRSNENKGVVTFSRRHHPNRSLLLIDYEKVYLQQEGREIGRRSNT